MNTDTTTNTIEVINYGVDLIDPSPYQMRKHFPEARLQEMAESIREHGIIQPLIARVSPVDESRLQLVAGERRLRGARLAGLQTVPVMVRELSDRVVLEMGLLENEQREDLTEGERARGYQTALDFRDESGDLVYTQETLAAKVGKPLSYVRDRLKLLLCPEFLIAAVEEGAVALSVAMLVGRVPETKAREQAAKLVLQPDMQDVPLGYAQTRELLKERFMMSLQNCGFDPEADDLVPVVIVDGARVMGGSCVDCPFFSGNAPAEGEDDPARNSAPVARKQRHGGALNTGVGMCTLPACWKKKQDAAWKITRSRAEEQNIKVIEGDVARALFRGHQGGLTYDSAYVQMDEKPDYDEIGNLCYDNKKPWKTLLKGKDLPLVIARHPVSGRRIELAPKKEAAVIAKALLKGTSTEKESLEDQGAAAKAKEARQAELRAGKIAAVTVYEGLGDLVDAMTAKGVDLDNADFLFQMALGAAGSDGGRIFAKWLKIEMPKGTVNSGRDYEEEILKLVRARVGTLHGWLAFIAAALLAKSLHYSGFDDEDFTQLRERFGVDDGAVKRRAVLLVDGARSSPKASKGSLRSGGLKSDEQGVPIEEVKSPADMTFEEQVGALVIGTHAMPEIIGKKPKDAVELKAWNARRVKLIKAVKKAESE